MAYGNLPFSHRFFCARYSQYILSIKWLMYGVLLKHLSAFYPQCFCSDIFFLNESWCVNWIWRIWIFYWYFAFILVFVHRPNFTFFCPLKCFYSDMIFYTRYFLLSYSMDINIPGTQCSVWSYWNHIESDISIMTDLYHFLIHSHLKYLLLWSQYETKIRKYETYLAPTSPWVYTIVTPVATKIPSWRSPQFWC